MVTVRKRPEFPEFKHENGFFSGILSFIFGIILWIGLLFLFAFVAYTEWFRSHMYSLLHRIKPKSYQIPFWFAAICVIFFFPITLFCILISALIEIIKD